MLNVLILISSKKLFLHVDDLFSALNVHNFLKPFIDLLYYVNCFVKYSC